MPGFNSVFLGGTTCGTTWRQRVIDDLMQRGVVQSQIINPHLPKGVKYTAQHIAEEASAKKDQHTLLFFNITAMAGTPDPDRLGPITMFEIGRHAFSSSFRTAVVIDLSSFVENGRSWTVLQGLANELRDEFGVDGGAPFFETMPRATAWIARMLLNK